MTTTPAEHRERLANLHPELIRLADVVLPAMALLGHPMFVVEGVRSEARQRALYAKGRTEPGKIVTNCDGMKARSAHQIHLSDGLGHAVDMAFQGADPWGKSHPWVVYGAIVRFLGLRWGGAFPSLVDKPHAEVA